MVSGLVSNVFAGEKAIIMDFLNASEYIAPYAKQEATTYNHSCGPTSTLFVYNYYKYKESGGSQVLFLGAGALDKAKWTIRQLYSFIGQSNNTDMRTFDPLVNIGVNKYNFTNVEQRSMYDSLNTNLEYLFEDLKNGIPAIVSLKGQNNGEGMVWQNGERVYIHKTHSTNPVGNWNHIVVVFGFDKKSYSSFTDNDTIYYFDPYFGKYHYMTLGELKAVANQDNMDYLRFGK